jgi:hypothetical protein
VKVAQDVRTTSDSEIDDRIRARIQKCLDRGNHPNTTESEAKAAIYLSIKLMRQYNVTTADLLERTEERNRTQYGGSSVVSITNSNDRSHRVIHQGFVPVVADAIEIFFDCKSFSERNDRSIDYTFYGIAENTVTAAMAFEMVHNRIFEWAL